MEIVVDTNVIVAGLRSNLGAGYQVLQGFHSGRYTPVLSVGLVLEYEKAIRNRCPHMTEADIDKFLNFLCSVGRLQRISYQWRPQVPDTNDDMVLEAAANAGCAAIVTYNTRDFRGADRFGIHVLTPQELLRRTEGWHEHNPDQPT
jgi:predicted nucleic acid-binding protein